MNLQKQLAYTCKGKQHYKNVVVPPDAPVLRLGLITGQELESEVRGNSLVIRPVGKNGEKKI